MLFHNGTPFKIGKMEVKNKISMAPMGAFGLVDNEGCYNQRAIDYYVERAKGGTGLIITGAVKAENEAIFIDVQYLGKPCIIGIGKSKESYTLNSPFEFLFISVVRNTD